MRSTLAGEFGVEYPIFAFSHCRDVVAEVSRRGGFGVLGGSSVTLDDLDTELRWIDEHGAGRPYGVDLLMPAKTADTGTRDPIQLREELSARVPREHRQFVRAILEENGLPTRPIDAPFKYTGRLSITTAGFEPMLDVILAHPLCRFFVSALGTPAPDIVRRFHDADVKVGALAGTVHHAERHVEGGVDVVIAQGTEAGGHTGEISTLVLTPDVVDAVSPAGVLSAGGIGTGRQIAACLALGARGVWTGSIWLTVIEAATTEDERAHLLAAGSTDTIRSKSRIGKPIRQLRSPWTEAWSRPGAPTPLDIPLQLMLVEDALADDAANVGREAGLMRPIVGQIVGRMNEIRSVRTVLDELVEELIATITGLPELLGVAD
jgi:NAD(P)H-dependent flavin oxidoreductase YrpB (nitropropane dioxygenase family)